VVIWKLELYPSHEIITTIVIVVSILLGIRPLPLTLLSQRPFGHFTSTIKYIIIIHFSISPPKTNELLPIPNPFFGALPWLRSQQHRPQIWNPICQTRIWKPSISIKLRSKTLPKDKFIFPMNGFGRSNFIETLNELVVNQSCI